MVIINLPKYNIHCRYFKSSSSCKRGDDCWYIHDDDKYEECHHYHTITGCCFGEECYYRHQDEVDNIYDPDIEAAKFLATFIDSECYQFKSKLMNDIGNRLKMFAEGILLKNSQNKMNKNANIISIDSKLVESSKNNVNDDNDNAQSSISKIINNKNMNKMEVKNIKTLEPSIDGKSILEPSLDSKSSLPSSLDDKHKLETPYDDKHRSIESSLKKNQNKMIKNNKLIKSKKKKYQNKKQKNKKKNKKNKKNNKILLSKDQILNEDPKFNDVIIKINKSKQTGNDYFMKDDFIKASFYYLKANKIMNQYISGLDKNDEAYIFKIKLLDDLRIKIYNNLSINGLKWNQYEGAMEYAQEVLNIDDKNIKALSRRCEAAAHLKNVEMARKDLDLIIKINGKNSLSETLEQMLIDLSI